MPALTLLVLRCSVLQRSRAFYTVLGCEPRSEQHGSGPLHFSIRCGATVLELHPADGVATTPIRLGLALTGNRQAVQAIAQCGGSVVRELDAAHGGQRWLIRDPDQNLLELEVR
jgi:catechol 2,3-dioxygenase-like lactoylglutathione lyase family enzyme